MTLADQLALAVSVLVGEDADMSRVDALLAKVRRLETSLDECVLNAQEDADMAERAAQLGKVVKLDAFRRPRLVTTGGAA